MNQLNHISYLNSIRVDRGPQTLKKMFQDLCQTNKMKALTLINATDITFSTLFILIPQVESFGLKSGLNSRNQIAFKFCSDPKIQLTQTVLQPVLKWILTTGAPEENLGDSFDEVLDHAATDLLINYKDKTILSNVVDLIFKRNRKGKYIHDLVWCLFKSSLSDCLPLVANYIRSNYQADNQLAYKLLNFKPNLQPNDKEQQYSNFNKWLNKNLSFLYATGDSLQQTSAPKYWRVNLGAKYLCNGITPDGTPTNPLTDNQNKLLNSFSQLTDKDQKALAKYSFKTFQANQQKWNEFMQAPIKTQLKIASTMTNAELGGLQ